MKRSQPIAVEIVGMDVVLWQRLISAGSGSPLSFRRVAVVLVTENLLAEVLQHQDLQLHPHLAVFKATAHLVLLLKHTQTHTSKFNLIVTNLKSFQVLSLNEKEVKPSCLCFVDQL